MSQFLFTLTFLFFMIASFAQSIGKVSGNIKGSGEKAEVPAGVTISLLRAKDSTAIKFVVSAKDGSYSFEKVANGKFLVLASSVGYKKHFSAPFEINAENQSVNLAPIELNTLPGALSRVTVTANRPLIEQKIDRTVVNVDASITNIGTSALEVLEKFRPRHTVQED